MVTKSNNSADIHQIYESDYLGLPAPPHGSGLSFRARPPVRAVAARIVNPARTLDL